MYDIPAAEKAALPSTGTGSVGLDNDESSGLIPIPNFEGHWQDGGWFDFAYIVSGRQSADVANLGIGEVARDGPG
jgi:hypothetical protein